MAQLNQPTTGNAGTVTTVTAANLAGAVTPSASGNVLTSNGSAWTSAAPPAAGAMTLLKKASGTSTATGVRDTVAITGLGSNDRIMFTIVGNNSLGAIWQIQIDDGTAGHLFGVNQEIGRAHV